VHLSYFHLAPYAAAAVTCLIILNDSTHNQ
jgi:hypothetical protein